MSTKLFLMWTTAFATLFHELHQGGFLTRKQIFVLVAEDNRHLIVPGCHTVVVDESGRPDQEMTIMPSDEFVVYAGSSFSGQAGSVGSLGAPYKAILQLSKCGSDGKLYTLKRGQLLRRSG